MGFQTTVDQVTLIGGGRYDQSGSILVDERTGRSGRRKRKGHLYVLVELSGPAIEREILTQQLTDLVRRTYYDWRGSITAGLQEAIRQANSFLFDENRHALPGEQWTAGITCAVVRGEDLFVAQAGPAAFFLRHEGETARFPDLSPWLDEVSAEEMGLAPLGARSNLNAALFHSPLTAGDTFLLADTAVVHNISAHRWPDVLAHTPVPVMIEEVLRLARTRNLAALAVQVGEGAAAGRPAQAAQQVRPLSEPELADRGPAAEAVRVKLPSSEPYPVDSLERWDAPEEEWEDEGWDMAGPGFLARFSLLWKRLTAGLGRFDLVGRLQRVGRALTMALAGLTAGLVSVLKSLLPGRSRIAEPPAARRREVKKASQAPRKRPRAQRLADIRSDPIQRLLIGIAIAIPVIVAIIVLVTWLGRGQARQAELEMWLSQAQSRWEQANATTDPVQVRNDLAQANQFLEQFLEEQPNDADANELWKLVAARLEVVNQVKRISWIGELASYPANANLTRVIVQGNHIFVMDRQNHRIYHHKLDDELSQALDPATVETVLVERGDEVGGTLVSNLVDMAWMPTGPGRETASLVILESGGGLLDYDPATDQLTLLRVADSATWAFPRFVGSHTGRLYVLDTSASNIWRFDPTLDGYSELPTKWLQSDIDLAGVADMAIGDSIYLLFADGTIRKFSQGAPDSFDVSDWDIPPNNPSAIFTRPPDETRWIYVADRGSRRIVQAGKDGKFGRQYRLAENQVTEASDVLAGAVALFVDEIVGRAYLLSGQKLYLLFLPMTQ
jgi:hypothetical protein